MGKLARVGGNSAIAARELQQWAHEAMQMGALAGGGKGKGKARLGQRGIRPTEAPANACAWRIC